MYLSKAEKEVYIPRVYLSLRLGRVIYPRVYLSLRLGRKAYIPPVTHLREATGEAYTTCYTPQGGIYREVYTPVHPSGRHI